MSCPSHTSSINHKSVFLYVTTYSRKEGLFIPHIFVMPGMPAMAVKKSLRTSKWVHLKILSFPHRRINNKVFMGRGITSTHLPLIPPLFLISRFTTTFALITWDTEWGRRRGRRIHDNHYAKKVICRASVLLMLLWWMDGCWGIWHHQKRIENHRNRGILLFTLQISLLVLRFLSNYICNYCGGLDWRRQQRK